MRLEFWMRNGGSSYWYQVNRETFYFYLKSRSPEIFVTLAVREVGGEQS